MNLVRRGLVMVYLLAGLLPTTVIHAQDMMMVRSAQRFPEAMLTLQTSIREHGYTLSRVQRVDIGLTQSGYKTDKYRVVFFGKPAEIERLTAAHPEMIAYLPLKMAIFAEQDETLVVASNPLLFREFFDHPELELIARRWESDFRSIMDDVRSAE